LTIAVDRRGAAGKNGGADEEEREDGVGVHGTFGNS
jgi:hypothetical protein